MAPVTVLIVDDSPSVRAVLRRFLARSEALRVVGEAADGLAAVDLVRRLRPDVLLLDLILPGIDGFQVLEQLAESGAVPTVILTSRADQSAVRAAFEALGSGAVDLLPKPEDPASWNQLAETLPDVLCVAAASAGAPGRPRQRRAARARSGESAPVAAASAAAPRPTRASAAPVAANRSPRSAPPLGWLAIGASTGGPAALRDLLAALPAPSPLKVVVVQHIASGFEPGLADWLSGSLGLDVQVAVDGELVPAGSVRLAPGGSHLKVDADGRLALDARSPPRRGHRPSVDELFLSLAAHQPAATAAALLTGMGVDGAAGLAALAAAGAFCLVQDEASSAVYGMPRAALELGAAELALAPRELGEEIARRIAERR